MTKSEFKKLIKECLVEIMVEGMGQEAGQKMTESVRSSSKNNIETHRVTSPRVQSRPVPTVRPRPTNPMVQILAGQKVGNSSLVELLEDTAATTLPQMMAAPDPEMAQHAMQSMISAQPEYDGTSSESSDYPSMASASPPALEKAWADVAFGPPSGRFTAPPTQKLDSSFLDQKVG